MAKNLRRIGVRLVLLLAVLAVAASAAPITASIGGTYDLSTATAANWTITAPTVLSGPAVVDAALTPSGGSISFNSTGTSTAAGYDGFWVAALSFTLPTGLGTSYTAALNFNNLYADDRVVLELNTTQIGNEGINGPGVGSMSLTDVVASPSYTFTLGGGSGLITSGFLTGTNTLYLYVNNTNNGIQGGLSTVGTSGVGLGYAQLTLTDPDPVSVPEPASLSYLLFGLVPLAIGFSRRRSRQAAIR